MLKNKSAVILTLTIGVTVLAAAPIAAAFRGDLSARVLLVVFYGPVLACVPLYIAEWLCKKLRK